MKTKRFKFKFINFSHEWELDEVKGDFDVVPNPTPYNNLPDGEYVIRGNIQYHRNEYWKIENVWHLVTTYDFDNGQYMCDAAEYLLFPNLSEKEWEILNHPIAHGKLSKYWNRALYGRNFWMELRQLSRDSKLNYNKFAKTYNENK